MDKQLFSSASGDWNTPDEVLQPLYEFDQIGLDPCSNSASIVVAKKALSLETGDNGLAVSWGNQGLVYVNPPYGRNISEWTEKIASEAQAGTELVVLVPSRTDTKWFQNLIASTNPLVLFWGGRLDFSLDTEKKNGAPFPSVLLYFGKRNQKFYNVFAKKGVFLRK